MNAGYDTSADIWSLACSIYELGTGRNSDFLIQVLFPCFFTDPTDRRPQFCKVTSLIHAAWKPDQKVGRCDWESLWFFGAHGIYDVGVFWDISYIRLLVTSSLIEWVSTTNKWHTWARKCLNLILRMLFWTSRLVIVLRKNQNIWHKSWNCGLADNVHLFKPLLFLVRCGSWRLGPLPYSLLARCRRLSAFLHPEQTDAGTYPRCEEFDAVSDRYGCFQK